jgi:hypothetical protein
MAITLENVEGTPGSLGFLDCIEAEGQLLYGTDGN